MRKYKCFSMIGMIIAFTIIIVGCTKPNVIIDWVDFIKLNDITYLSVPGEIKPGSQGKEIGQVKFKVAGKVDDPEYKSKNGDAAFLEKGTVVYSIKGYKPQFRVAVKTPEGLKI